MKGLILHQIIAFLKDAVARGPGGGINSCYIVRDGSIYCRNMTLQAGVEMESEVPFIVPAEELDAALKRMKEIQSLTVNEDNIVVKSGRLKSTIKTYDGEPPPIPEMPEEWHPYPPGLIAALNLAKGFIGDRPGTDGIRLMQNRVTAQSGQAGIDITVEDLELENQILIPIEAAEFLIAQGEAKEYALDKNAAYFRWEDGRWLKTQLLIVQFPHDAVERIYADAGDNTEIDINQEWREACEDVEALCDEVFLITDTGFKGFKGAATHDVEFETGLPEKHTSSWSMKYMKMIFPHAESWHPLSYPKPALFNGPGFRGVVMGFRR